MRRGVLVTLLAFVAYAVVNYFILLAIAPYTIGWSDSFMQVFVRFPAGLALYALLRKGHPLRKIRPGTFLKFMLFYLVCVQIPVQMASPFLKTATVDTIADDCAASLLLNQFLVGPIVEEILFRGVLFSFSRKFMSFWPSALVNAAIFSFMHYGDLMTMAVTAMIAALLCAFYEATGHIRYGIAMHLSFNLLALPMVLLRDMLVPAAAVPLFAISTMIHLLLVIRHSELMSRLLPAEEI